MARTTANVLSGIEAILHDVQQMEDALRDAQVIDADRRRLRFEIVDLRRRAELLMSWLGESRLEETRH